ncbi:hypothetical protein JOL79_06775 [Microbispora sp. RL4-1S]|uniref:Uncharacterized protein n=1 Tax=Microbispora oryzae TaxID=2806554 RepID=A0A940WDL5_9ACTN|nr:hypothetical protein [Microbispora oryzae]MBP2703501.1 hypothetical protein [Microbispora oryzae]
MNSTQTRPTARERAAEQLATIARAIEHLRGTDSQVLRKQLAGTDIGRHWKTRPGALADELARVTRYSDKGLRLGTWHCARQVLAAADLPVE